MKIGIIGQKTPDSKANLISDGLNQLGIENEIVFTLKVESRYLNFLFKLLEEQISGFGIWRHTRLLKHSHTFDFLINTEQEFHPNVVEQLRRKGKKVLFWFPDGIGNVSDRQYIFTAPYDYIFVTDPVFAKSLRDLYSRPAHYLPESFNPSWHISSEHYGVEKTCIVVGNYYPSRLTILNQLLADGIPLQLYGHPPKKWIEKNLHNKLFIHKPLYTNQKADAFRKAAVVLNLSHPYDVNSTNQRLFEAAGAGGVIITNRTDAVNELFSDGEEILTFSDYSDLLNKINFVFDNPEIARSIAERARKKAFESHQISQRLETILEIAGFNYDSAN